MARLATGFWVQAYRMRLSQEGIAAFVTSHGDETAGAVLIKLNTLDGHAVAYHRVPDLTLGTRRWEALAEGAEAEVDAQISRQVSFDPDLWVIEVEDRAGRHLLEEPGLDG